MSRLFKRYFALFIKCVVLPGFAIYLLFISYTSLAHIIPNNFRAKTLLRNIEQTPAPEGSKKIGEHSYIGWINGCGSCHRCEIIAGIIYGIDDISNVERHFSDKSVESVEKEGSISVESIILRSDGKRNNSSYLSGINNDEFEKRIKSLEKLCGREKNCYYAYALDESSLNMDYRCY